MKKIYGIVILMLVLFILPTQVFAVDFSIETMQIDAELQENGDVNVTEKQTYQFDSSFNGITRTLIPKEGTAIADVAAMEGSHALEIEKEEDTYRIHRKGDNEQVTITLTYTIKDGVTVYSDVAEFYWPFFDARNEHDYEQFDITVYPPVATDDVIALGYDTAEGTEEMLAEGAVHFNLGHVPSGEKGDIRVAYENTLFPTATVTQDKPMRDTIASEEQRLIDERIAFEDKQNNLQQIGLYVISLLALGLIGLLYFAWRKQILIKAEVDRQFATPYFVPEETMSLPATVSYMKAGVVQPHILTTALLELVRKGYVKQVEDEAFTVSNRQTTYEHETILIEWLFDKIGHDGAFKMADLKAYTDIEENLETYQQDFAKWQQAVQDEVKQHDLFVKHPKTRLFSALIGVALIPFVIFLGIYHVYMLMAFGIVLAIGYLTFASFFKTRTLTGAKIKRDWQAFQDKYPEIKDEEWEELVTDEQKRAFSYGVGIDDKTIDRKNEALLNRFQDTHDIQTSPMSFLLFATLANNHFHHAHTTSAASTSSSTSVGGGTGVGGGGGGSGAF